MVVTSKQPSNYDRPYLADNAHPNNTEEQKPKASIGYFHALAKQNFGALDRIKIGELWTKFPCYFLTALVARCWMVLKKDCRPFIPL